jgi:putative DNA primase/helicase
MTDYGALASEYETCMPNTRPEIVVRDELVAVTDEALAALQGADGGLYVRGRLLVQISGSEAVEKLPWLRRPVGGWVIVPLEVPSLQDRLDRAARWVRLKKGLAVPARPPEWVAKQVMARLAWPFPLLSGVIETPTLRPDGTVLDRPGYDADTGLLYTPNADYGSVPELTKAEVPTLVQALLDPVCDFPFVHDTDRATYVAAILSIVGRHAIPGPVPAFPVVAPVPGAGKGLLTRIMTLIGTGREPAVMTVPGDDIEFRKRLLVLAIAGTPVVVLDNVSGTIGSDQLAAALTLTEFTDRLLGVSRLVTAPLTAIWFVTGNNVRFGRTLGRRMVPITLDPENEHPEDRSGFRYPDVIGRVKARRPALVTAALALLHGYVLAGRPPHDEPKMGSFEQWDDLIRGAAIWAGLADPAAVKDAAKGRGRVRAEGDDDLDQLDSLLDALTTGFGGSPFQVPDVLAKIDIDPALRAACQGSATDRKGSVTANSIGNAFRNMRDRWVHGRKLVKTPKAVGLPRGAWRVQPRGEVP